MQPYVTTPEIKVYGSRLRISRSHAMLFCVLPSVFPYGFSSERETAGSLRISFEGQNMKFTANVLLTCIIYCDAGPGCD